MKRRDLESGKGMQRGDKKRVEQEGEAGCKRVEQAKTGDAVGCKKVDRKGMKGDEARQTTLLVNASTIRQ